MKKEIRASVDMPVIYIGTKKEKQDRTFGTRLRFTPGQMHLVNSDIAHRMLGVHDIYTTYNTPELAAFVKDNPILAQQQGLTDLSEDEMKVLLSTAPVTPAPTAEPAPQADSNEAITVLPKGGQAALDAEHLEQVKATINRLPNIPAIAEWAKDNALDVELPAKGRSQVEQMAVDAYAQKYIKG